MGSNANLTRVGATPQMPIGGAGGNQDISNLVNMFANSFGGSGLGGG